MICKIGSNRVAPGLYTACLQENKREMIFLKKKKNKFCKERRGEGRGIAAKRGSRENQGDEEVGR